MLYEVKLIQGRQGFIPTDTITALLNQGWQVLAFAVNQENCALMYFQRPIKS